MSKFFFLLPPPLHWIWALCTWTLEPSFSAFWRGKTSFELLKKPSLWNVKAKNWCYLLEVLMVERDTRVPIALQRMCEKLDGGPGLVVMGGASCWKGRGFEPQHRILDGHISHYFSSLKRTERTKKSSSDQTTRDWQWLWLSW